MSPRFDRGATSKHSRVHARGARDAGDVRHLQRVRRRRSIGDAAGEHQGRLQRRRAPQLGDVRRELEPGARAREIGRGPQAGDATLIRAARHFREVQPHQGVVVQDFQNSAQARRVVMSAVEVEALTLTLSTRLGPIAARQARHTSTNTLVRLPYASFRSFDAPRNCDSKYPCAAWTWTPSKPLRTAMRAARPKALIRSSTSCVVIVTGVLCNWGPTPPSRKLWAEHDRGRRQLAATGDWRPGCDSCTSTRAPPLLAARAQCETCFVSVVSSKTTFRGASRARRSTMTLPVMTKPQPPAAHRP